MSKVFDGSEEERIRDSVGRSDWNEGTKFFRKSAWLATWRNFVSATVRTKMTTVTNIKLMSNHRSASNYEYFGFPAWNYRRYRYSRFLYRVQDHGRLHISKYSPFSGQVHIQAFTFSSRWKISRPRSNLRRAHIQVFVQKLARSTRESRELWTRSPVLTSQTFHSRACLNLHLSDIHDTYS